MTDQSTEETPQVQETKEPESAPAASSESQRHVAESEPTAAPAVPETNTETQPTGPVWPELTADHPLSKLSADLPAILEKAGYDEVYGLKLSDVTSFHTKLILQKFLRANANDLVKAKEQLLGTLKWRKEFEPLKAVEEEHSKDKFGGLGYVTVLSDVPGSSNEKDVVTFNIYGAVKDNKKTFGDIERLVASLARSIVADSGLLTFLTSFLRWRVALMELSIQELDLASATRPIPDHGNGPDPYQGIQIHDYLNISFIRQDPAVKAASKKTIDTFSAYYPEMLSRKFFINVPVVMGWVFQAFKLILPKETIRKFTVLSYGNQLASELGPGVPQVYGGKGESLEQIGETVKLA